MPASRPPSRPGSDEVPPATRRALPVGAAVTALVLLAIPVAALLAVPLYARDEPELFGFPFFYWFQLLAVIVASLLTTVAFVVVQRARSRGGRR